MVMDPIAHRAGSVSDLVRIGCAASIAICLSSAPYVSLTRWVTDQPLAIETWPYLYTLWGAALLGAGLFVLDVIGPLVVAPLGRSVQLVVAIAVPVALGLWALLSAIWTKSPARTPQQALLMAMVLLTAIWFGYALTFRQQVTSLFVSLQLLTVISMFAAAGLTSGRLPDDDS